MRNLKDDAQGRFLLDWVDGFVPGVKINEVWHTDEENKEALKEIEDKYEKNKEYWDKYKKKYYYGEACPKCSVDTNDNIEEGYLQDLSGGGGGGSLFIGCGTIDIKDIKTGHLKWYKCKACGDAWKKSDYDSTYIEDRTSAIKRDGFKISSEIGNYDYVRENYTIKTGEIFFGLIMTSFLVCYFTFLIMMVLSFAGVIHPMDWWGN